MSPKLFSQLKKDNILGEYIMIFLNPDFESSKFQSKKNHISLKEAMKIFNQIIVPISSKNKRESRFY